VAETAQNIDPKAQAKADKAYAKAMRPWYKKKRYIIGLGLLLLIVIGVAANASGGEDPPSTAQPANQEPSAEEPAAEAPAEAADPTVLADDGWEVDTFNVADNGIGSFGASARIVNNTGGDVGAATFTMTVLEGGDIIATLIGSAMGVAAGDTATVDFVSDDPIRTGQFVYDFQVDASF